MCASITDFCLLWCSLFTDLRLLWCSLHWCSLAVMFASTDFRLQWCSLAVILACSDVRFHWCSLAVKFPCRDVRLQWLTERKSSCEQDIGPDHPRTSLRTWIPDQKISIRIKLWVENPVKKSHRSWQRTPRSLSTSLSDFTTNWNMATYIPLSDGHVGTSVVW